MPKETLNIHFDDNTPWGTDENTGLRWHRSIYRVLYADTDAAAIVYHANYLRFFEMARASFLRDSGTSYRIWHDQGLVFPVIETGLQYKRALVYDDIVWILTRPSALRPVTFRFDYCVFHPETKTLCTTGFTTHAVINSARKPVAVPPDLQTVFNSSGVVCERSMA